MRSRSLLKINAAFLAVTLFSIQYGWAGPQRFSSRSGFIAGGAVGAQTQIYYYPGIYNPWPNYPSVVVISPYGPSYYLPPAAVVTAPFYCAFDNHGFVSRIGLLDHLSGMHRIPLEAAATLCPGDTASCVCPSY